MINRSLTALYPPFAEKVQAILTEWTEWCAVHKPGWTAYLSEGYRSTARQQALYAQGRTAPGEIVTQKNGTTNPSNHQSCLAADIVLANDGEPSWNLPDEAWQYLGHLARAKNLTWGGDWHGFVDLPHVEWPSTDHQTYQKARAWKQAQGLT